MAQHISECVVLAKEIKELVDEKAQYTDWSVRDDVKNKLNMDLTIEQKLTAHGSLRDRSEVIREEQSNGDAFSTLSIPRPNVSVEPTDLEKSRFMSSSFFQINKLLGEL